MLTMNLPVHDGAADMPVIEGPFTIAIGDGMPVVAICGFLEDADSGVRVGIRIPIMNVDAPEVIDLLKGFCERGPEITEGSK
ncbi:hypothetical protein [Arenibaculum pallidiluteum]|uniref:hypothetical protein n=1 Tax=Arenibaculum pallidiluteum TaxID=2812559 RepID=UPI001A97999B|nr:hypothetical protein [Arenibaculum pallidiluteum]